MIGINDLDINILIFCFPIDIINVGCVNKYFNSIYKNDRIWIQKIKEKNCNLLKIFHFLRTTALDFYKSLKCITQFFPYFPMGPIYCESQKSFTEGEYFHADNLEKDVHYQYVDPRDSYDDFIDYESHEFFVTTLLSDPIFVVFQEKGESVINIIVGQFTSSNIFIEMYRDNIEFEIEQSSVKLIKKLKVPKNCNNIKKSDTVNFQKLNLEIENLEKQYFS